MQRNLHLLSDYDGFVRKRCFTGYSFEENCCDSNIFEFNAIFDLVDKGFITCFRALSLHDRLLSDFEVPWRSESSVLRFSISKELSFQTAVAHVVMHGLFLEKTCFNLGEAWCGRSVSPTVCDCACFTFQNMCFQISDIGKHVFWHHILYWEWEEDDWPEIYQKFLRCRRSSVT